MTGESEATGNTGHHSGYQMVQISIRGGSQFEGTEADIVEGFVINTDYFISILNLRRRKGRKEEKNEKKGDEYRYIYMRPGRG